MEISIASDVTHQPSSTSPKRRQPPVVTTNTFADPVLDQFHSEIEHLEKKDFLTFRNGTVKLLNKIQYKAKKCKRQVTTSQQVSTYQLPEASQATAGHEYFRGLAFARRDVFLYCHNGPVLIFSFLHSLLVCICFYCHFIKYLVV